MMKIWNIQLQHCLESTMHHQNEIWSIAISSDETQVYTGAADNQLRVWSVDKIILNGYLENRQGETLIDPQHQIFSFKGSIQKNSHERTLGLKLLSFEDSSLLLCTVSQDFDECNLVKQNPNIFIFLCLF